MIENICIILGTRPEVVKMSHVVRACERRGQDWFMVHTGQERSYGVGRVFFEQLGLPDARYNLNVGSGRHGGQTGRMLAGGMMLWTSLRGFRRVLFGADNIL